MSEAPQRDVLRELAQIAGRRTFSVGPIARAEQSEHRPEAGRCLGEPAGIEMRLRPGVGVARHPCDGRPPDVVVQSNHPRRHIRLRHAERWIARRDRSQHAVDFVHATKRKETQRTIDVELIRQRSVAGYRQKFQCFFVLGGDVGGAYRCEIVVGKGRTSN